MLGAQASSPYSSPVWVFRHIRQTDLCRGTSLLSCVKVNFLQQFSQIAGGVDRSRAVTEASATYYDRQVEPQHVIVDRAASGAGMARKCPDGKTAWVP